LTDLIEKQYQDGQKTQQLLKKRITDLENHLLNTKAELAKRNEILRLTRLELDKTKEDLAASLAITIPQARKIEELTIALKRSEDFRASAEAQCRMQLEKIEHQKRVIAERDKELEEAAALAKEQRTRIRNLTKRKTELETLVADLETTVVAMRNLTKSLQKKLDDTRAKLAETEENLRRTSQELTDTYDKLAQSEENLAKARQTIEDRDQELRETNATLDRARAERDHANKQIAEWTIYIKDLEEKKTMLTTSFDNAHTNLQKLRAQLQRTDNDRIHAEETISARDKSLEAMLAAKATTDSMMARLQRNYNNEMESRKTLEKLLKRTNEKLRATEGELSDANEKLGVQKSAVTKMKRNLKM